MGYLVCCVYAEGELISLRQGVTGRLCFLLSVIEIYSARANFVLKRNQRRAEGDNCPAPWQHLGEDLIIWMQQQDQRWQLHNKFHSNYGSILLSFRDKILATLIQYHYWMCAHYKCMYNDNIGTNNRWRTRWRWRATHTWPLSRPSNNIKQSQESRYKTWW